MSTNFNDLGKHLRELEAFATDINSMAANVEFDPKNSASIEAAMSAADQHIDQVAGRYTRNLLVKEFAQTAKSQIREQILEQAANLRLENKDDSDMTLHNEVVEHLNEAAETVLELQSADYQTIQRPMKSLARLIRSPILDPIVAPLTEGIDLDAWLKAGFDTQGGMVGSAVLCWPDSTEAQLGTTVLLIQRMAEDSGFMENFSFTFYYAGNQYTSTLRKMVGSVIVPFERKFARYVKAKFQLSSSYSQPTPVMNNITITNSQVGAVQTGESSVARVSMSGNQNHLELSESLLKLAEQLKVIGAIPGHDKDEILNLIEDSRSELAKEKPSKAKLNALLPIISGAVGLVSDVGGAFAAVQAAARLAGFPF